jgi:hypothetical protein
MREKMNTVSEMHKQAIQAIYSTDYYVEIFHKIASFSPEKVYDMEDEVKICDFWNTFWFALPDNKNIRREPFFLICDLAEGGYLEESSYTE